ncbi:MAG: oligosaccharide flippase family protein [Sphingomonadales bacterium]|nr:oligosaccharide flippase family protein [Sphingomonadales bacterium]
MVLAGRLYGPALLGRYASALVVIELVGQFCTLGQKRGLAQRLSEEESHAANIVADGIVLSCTIAAVAALVLWLFPAPMFPGGHFTWVDRLLILSIFPNTITDVALAALAYRYDVATTVRSRSVVDPWALSLSAAVLWPIGTYGHMPLLVESGLPIAKLVSVFAAAAFAVVPLVRSYGLPRQWRPHPMRIGRLALAAMPVAAADAVEWGTRKLDIAILGFFATPTAVGVYFAAQQVATLPQKLKTSFEPILGPVITRNLKERDYGAIARQVCQVGFWITAAQGGIALALAIPGHAVMSGLFGVRFGGGTGALVFLLFAEVAAATAVVSEAALIYMARIRNLYVSLGTIVFQGLLTIAGIELVEHWQLGELYRDAAAAAALLVTLSVASLVKSRMLSRLLDQSINNWRWSLIAAGVVAGAVGGGIVAFAPRWAHFFPGIPLILGVWCWIIWHWGFGPDDRVLFRRNVGGDKSAPA